MTSPDKIYCHKCDNESTYTLTHASSARREYGDVFYISAYLDAANDYLGAGT